MWIAPENTSWSQGNSWIYRRYFKGIRVVGSDGDGVGDNADAFPSDPSESADTDGYGVGDNRDATLDSTTQS